jgi:hypothetical protein
MVNPSICEKVDKIDLVSEQKIYPTGLLENFSLNNVIDSACANNLIGSLVAFVTVLALVSYFGYTFYTPSHIGNELVTNVTSSFALSNGPDQLITSVTTSFALSTLTEQLITSETSSFALSTVPEQLITSETSSFALSTLTEQLITSETSSFVLSTPLTNFLIPTSASLATAAANFSTPILTEQLITEEASEALSSGSTLSTYVLSTPNLMPIYPSGLSAEILSNIGSSLLNTYTVPPITSLTPYLSQTNLLTSFRGITNTTNFLPLTNTNFFSHIIYPTLFNSTYIQPGTNIYGTACSCFVYLGTCLDNIPTNTTLLLGSFFRLIK